MMTDKQVRDIVEVAEYVLAERIEGLEDELLEEIITEANRRIVCARSVQIPRYDCGSLELFRNWLVKRKEQALAGRGE